MLGLFDSGSGGLTILHQIRAQHPDLDICYLGDHAKAPYGHRSNAQIVDWTRRGVAHLFGAGCTLVILACNTAAAIALRTLQQDWLDSAYPGRRILGVLVPMVEAVTGQPWHSTDVATGLDRQVALFATAKTIASGAYRDEVMKRAPNLRLLEQACPGLVDAIEGGAGIRPLRGLVQGYVAEALDRAPAPHAAVLGCTHFPLVEQLFKDALPAATQVYGQPKLVADALADYRTRHPDLLPCCDTGRAGTLTLLTTGDPDAVQAASGLPDLRSPFTQITL